MLIEVSCATPVLTSRCLTHAHEGGGIDVPLSASQRDQADGFPLCDQARGLRLRIRRAGRDLVIPARFSSVPQESWCACNSSAPCFRLWVITNGTSCGIGVDPATGEDLLDIGLLY